MTDITKRLAEAPLQWQEGVAGNCNIVTYNGEDVVGIGFVADPESRTRIIRKHNEVVAAFDRTAAQEANVQGGERYVTFKDTGIYVDLARYFATPEGKAALHKFDPAAPHPTPAPASGEVTDAEVEAACIAYIGAKPNISIPRMGIAALTWENCGQPWRENARKEMRIALEAATRARQWEGEPVASPGPEPLYFWRERWYGSEPQKGRAIIAVLHSWSSHGEEVAYFGEGHDDAVQRVVEEHNRAVRALTETRPIEPQAGTVAAQGEAYRAVTLEDASTLLKRYTEIAEYSPWAGEHDLLQALQSIGAVIPTAAPVPADEGNHAADELDRLGDALVELHKRGIQGDMP